MLKIFIFVFFIAGHVRSYTFEESTEPDSLGNCTAMYPRNHVVRRACYSAHAVCRRYNLNPTFVENLKSNTKVYNDIEMKLPSGASIPYSIYEAEPSLFDELHDKILVQTDPPVSLSDYRRIINDSDFRIARALHSTGDQVLLSEMIEMTLDYLDKDDVTAVVGSWFQGDFKIIVPLIDDYLPELENVTTVQVADNYPKLAEVKKVMNDRNITLEKVNPRDVSPIITTDGLMSVEEIRKILDFFKKPNNATVLPGVEYERVRNTLYPVDAVPVWQWMKAYDELHSNDYQNRYSEQIPVIQLMTRNETTNATENTISAKTVESDDSTDFSILPETTTYSSDVENLENSSPIGVESEVVQVEMSRANLEIATDDPLVTRFSESRLNKEYSTGDSKRLPKQGKASKSDSDDELPEENFVELEPNAAKNDSKTNSAVDTKSIRDQVVDLHLTVDNSQPHFESSSPKNDSADHFSTATFFKKENETEFQNKIFTTCALYYLKVNGTQNRVILSEAGILSFPMRRICDELLHLETYNGSRIERLEQRPDFQSLENSNLLARVEENSSGIRDQSNVQNPSSFLKTANRSSGARSVGERFEVDSNVPSAAELATAVGYGAESGRKPATRVHLSRLSERYAKRSLGNYGDFPISSFDVKKHNGFNQFSRQRSHSKIHKATPNRFNSPPYQTGLGDSFFHDMETLSDHRLDKLPNHYRTKHLPKPAKNYYQRFEMPDLAYEPHNMDPYATSEMEEESDFDVAYADEDRFPPNKGYKHFGRASSYPHRRKNYDLNRSIRDEKWKPTREEAEDYEDRLRYLATLKDPKENNNIW